MPFGGWKYSGLGTEGVLSTFEEMTRVKTIVLKNLLIRHSVNTLS
jgi:succinate-semialdehyde dehydrogenase/glutarate-semialdehyde dehydrogenase